MSNHIGNEKGTTANSSSDWFRFQWSPPASAPDAKADDSTGDCAWAGMTKKQRKTAMFWNSYKNTYLFAPNIRLTSENFPNFFLIYLTMKTCETSFFWLCFDIVLLFYCTLLLFQIRIKLFNKYCASYLFQNNFRKQKQKVVTWCVIFCNILQNFEATTWHWVYWRKKTMEDSHFEIFKLVMFQD